MAIALDGTPRATTTATAQNQQIVDSGGNGLSTTNAGDIICLVSLYNGGGPLVSVTSTHTTSWAHRATATQSTGNALELWLGFASAALSNEVSLTANFTGTQSFVKSVVFAFSGLPSYPSTDPNGSLPGTAASAVSAPATITTSNANAVLIGALRNGSSSPTQGTGWTLIVGVDFLMVEYQLVSATQSGTVVTSAGASDPGASIGDALSISSGAGVTPGFQRVPFRLGMAAAAPWFIADRLGRNKVIRRRQIWRPDKW